MIENEIPGYEENLTIRCISLNENEITDHAILVKQAPIDCTGALSE